MKKTSILWIIEISIIALIPAFSLFYEFIEDSVVYKVLFHFDVLEDVITYRLGGEYTELIPNEEIGKLKPITVAEYSIFKPVWDLIKKHSLAKLSEDKPSLISRPVVENAPTVHLFKKDYTLVPDSVPIVVLYCDDPINDEVCKGGKVVGTLSDFKDWLEKEKQGVRNSINLIIGTSAIFLGLVLWHEERKKSYLLLE